MNSRRIHRAKPSEELSGWASGISLDRSTMSTHSRMPDPRTHHVGVARKGFRSTKTPLAVNYPSRWHADFLIQLSLSPRIQSIQANSDRYERNVFSVIVGSDAGTSIIAAATDGFDCSGLPASYRIIRRSKVMEEPRRLNCRLVWACARTHVPASDRMRVLTELTRHPTGVTLGRAAKLILASSADSFESIFSLVCGGVATVDYAAPLTPDSLVWGTHPGGPASPSDPIDSEWPP